MYIYSSLGGFSLSSIPPTTSELNGGCSPPSPVLPMPLNIIFHDERKYNVYILYLIKLNIVQKS